MGFWNSVTDTVSNAWDAVTGAAGDVWNAIGDAFRWLSNVVIEAFFRVVNIVDLFLGFLDWPSKNLRIQIFILRIDSGNFTANVSDLQSSIDFAKNTFKKNFNTNLLPYKGKEFVKVLDIVTPEAALNVHCNGEAYAEDFKGAGDFFNSHRRPGLAITIYIVQNVVDKGGCSIGPLSDYVTLDPDGIENISTLAHECGHCCGLWHSTSISNLMWPNHDRGDGEFWWQHNIFRSSRHVTYW